MGRTLQDVDVVELQALQTRLHRVEDMLRYWDGGELLFSRM